MAKYRKKPVVISAEQWFQMGDNKHVVMRESGDDPSNPRKEVPMIFGLEGWHIVSPGDWIITGVQGERYPCKPAIFAATYDYVEA